MSTFAYVITYKDELNENHSLILNTVNDGTVNLESTLTTHPLINGDFVADHKYDNPITMNISGTISTNSNSLLDLNGSRYGILKQIQSQFEYIKKEGILCTISKVFIDESNKKHIRFQKRNNMVLQSISWTEKVNSLAYDFNFTEVMIADVPEFDVDVHDTLLPEVAEFNQYNFTDTLLDINELDQQIIQVLIDYDITDNDFLNYCLSLSGAGILIGTGASILLGAIAAGLIATGVGAIFVIAVVAVGAIVGAAYCLNKYFENLARYGGLKSYAKFKEARNLFGEIDEKETQKRAQELSDFMGDIHTAMADFNNYINVYQVSKEGPQENWINIDGDYYKIRFYRNNVAQGQVDTDETYTEIDGAGNVYVGVKEGGYGISVRDINNTVVGVMSNISAAPITFTDCSKPLFITSSGANVYIVRHQTSTNESQPINLLDYYLVISKVTPQQYTNTITQIIENHLFR